MPFRSVAKSMAVATLVSLISGCATTDLTSRINPSAADRQFQTVLAFATFQDLELRSMAEERLCQQIEEGTTSSCIEAADLFFPGQQFTDQEVRERLVGAGVDAVIAISATNAGTNRSYVPPSYATTQTHGSVVGNAYSETSTTQVMGGGTSSRHWASFQCQMVAVEDAEPIWFATANTKAQTALVGVDDLVRSVTSRMFSQLLSDGVLQARATE